MTGTGTQSDPYIIQNINDLYNMATVGGSDKHFKLGADISYDATQYVNDFVPITLNCAELDGNNHTIANASAYSASENVSFFKVVCSTTVKYLNVENLILNSDVPSIFATESSSTFTISLQNCNIAIQAITQISSYANTAATLLHGENLTVNVSLCSFVITGTENSHVPFINGGSLVSTMFRLDIKYLSASVPSSAAFLNNANMTDCGFLGTVKLLTSTSGANYYFAENGEHTNSYSAVVFNGMKYAYWDAYIRSTCIWRYTDNTNITLRNDKGTLGYIKSFEINSMKNAATLRNYGFNCEG